MDHFEFKALVDEFVSLVVVGRSLAAMERFYAEAVTMQENLDAPRIGKAACLAHEQRNLEGCSQAPVAQAKSVGLDAEREVAMIHWRISARLKSGQHIALDEIAMQQWREGQIVSERFIYERVLDLNVPADQKLFGA